VLESHERPACVAIEGGSWDTIFGMSSFQYCFSDIKCLVELALCIEACL
jgi:hypothetical protein